MKTYKRVDFIELPANTIYSRINENVYGELMYGLFSKTSGPEFDIDWIEQDLISENGYPNNTVTGIDAIEYNINLRDTYQDFETDLDCGSRDGSFEDTDRFVVWDKKDITKLRDYLNNSLENFNK